MAAKRGRPPGQPKTGGRAVGAQNKATKNAREAIALLVDSNSERLQAWLDTIAAEEGAMAAWRCMMDVIEYHVPKLSRTVVTGDNGEPIKFESTVTFVRPPKRGE